jgi:hypothetical protein
MNWRFLDQENEEGPCDDIPLEQTHSWPRCTISPVNLEEFPWATGNLDDLVLVAGAKGK